MGVPRNACYGCLEPSSLLSSLVPAWPIPGYHHHHVTNKCCVALDKVRCILWISLNLIPDNSNFKWRQHTFLCTFAPLRKTLSPDQSYVICYETMMMTDDGECGRWTKLFRNSFSRNEPCVVMDLDIGLTRSGRVVAICPLQSLLMENSMTVPGS